MTAELGRQLQAAAIQTFEDLCFLCAAPWPEAEFPAMAAAASVAFDGPHRGRVELHCTGPALATLTDNMLGMAGAAPALQRDAIGELANVICGNLLPALTGPDAVYRLSPPVPCARDVAPGLTVATRLLLERGAAEVRLYLAVR